MFRNAGHALVILTSVATVLGFFILAKDEAMLGRHIVLIPGDNSEPPAVQAEVRRLRDSGFTVTNDLDTVVERLEAEGSNVTVFAVSRHALEDVPIDMWGDRHRRGVVLIGLDVAMRELEPRIYGVSQFTTIEGGGTMLPYTPGRPIFSMITNACGRSGHTSDWLGNFDIAALAIERSSENCPSPTNR